MNKIYWFLFLFFLNASSLTHALGREFFPGEELTYSVKYSLLELGEIKFRVLRLEDRGGRNNFRAIAYIDSRDNIPFVNLHEIYESSYNPGDYSDFFRATQKSSGQGSFTEYVFNYSKGSVRVKKGTLNPFKLGTPEILQVTGPVQDGLSIFYFARSLSGSDRSLRVPCYINEKEVKASIRYYSRVEPIKISSIAYRVAAQRIEGNMDFVSIFGLTGDFSGYFTADKYAVPLRAKLKVIIGDIVVELKSWRITGWIPPKFN